VVVLCYHLDLLVKYLPKLDSFVWMSARNKGGAYARTVRTEQEMCRVLPLAPLDPVDLFLDLERFQVVKLWLM
jgi:hypothetical protein